MKSKTITVLGAGSWGTALAILLAKNGHQVILWGRNKDKISTMQDKSENTFFLPGIQFPENLSLSSDLQYAVLQSEELLVVVPSHAFRDTLLKVKEIKPQLQRIIWATKGLEPVTQKLPHSVVDEVFQEPLANQEPSANREPSANQEPSASKKPSANQRSSICQAVISGPTFAAEVATGLPTALTVAANDLGYAQEWADFLCNETLRPYISQDIVGLEIGGAAKNVMAIAAGIADGLGYGANTRAALITRGLHEISCLSRKLGAKDQTIMGLSGLGDLLLTCTDDQSRNRRMGLAIGHGKSIEQAEAEIQQVVEGVQAARQIYSLSQELKVEMPIVEQVYFVLYQGLSPQKAVQNLLTRDYKSE